jgi:hypothetical protein
MLSLFGGGGFSLGGGRTLAFGVGLLAPFFRSLLQNSVFGIN